MKDYTRLNVKRLLRDSTHGSPVVCQGGLTCKLYNQQTACCLPYIYLQKFLCSIVGNMCSVLRSDLILKFTNSHDSASVGCKQS